MHTNTASDLLQEVRARLRRARRVFVLTGAGVSAESGVPTFRGGGNAAVWKGMPFSLISSAEMLERDLPAVWEWFDYRRDALKDLQPNPAHHALAKMQDNLDSFALGTQNIDDLHTRAGSRGVLELHGNIWRARCTRCQARIDLRTADEGERPPACRTCGAPMRPDVVLFGEMLPAGVFERAAAAAMRCDLCFVVGTSALVYPAMQLPEIALQAGAYIVEINPEQTPFSDRCHATLQGRAGEVLKAVTSDG
ncbi:MAG: NAD-dependent protein deacylase [Acidobacteria bacterium]|nr:MAG: NAD-dependent protein deacylase [Acidobacteriota bacterium]